MNFGSEYTSPENPEVVIVRKDRIGLTERENMRWFLMCDGPSSRPEYFIWWLKKVL